MRNGTKIALAASAFLIVGAAGLSSLATADGRGSGGAGYHGSGGHQSRGMMRRGHHGSRQKGWGHKSSGHKGWGMHMMMQRFDTNEDGKLTQEELNEARKTLLATHDADKDGKLTLAEYEKLWLEVNRQRMVRSFQRTDLDGDASVTLDEFLKPYAKMIARMDRNGDGVLDSKDRGYRSRDGDDDDRPRKRDGMAPRGG